MNDKIIELRRKRDTIVIFRGLGKYEVISDLMYLIGADTENVSDFIKYYSDFIESLYSHTTNLSEYILKLLLEDENMYIIKKAQGLPVDPLIEECVYNELSIFQDFSRLKPDDFIQGLDYDGYLPKWRISEIDFCVYYEIDI